MIERQRIKAFHNHHLVVNAVLRLPRLLSDKLRQQIIDGIGKFQRFYFFFQSRRLAKQIADGFACLWIDPSEFGRQYDFTDFGVRKRDNEAMRRFFKHVWVLWHGSKMFDFMKNRPPQYFWVLSFLNTQNMNR